MANYLLPFQRQKSNQPWFEKLQDYLDRFFAIICRNPFVDGQEIGDVALAAGIVKEIPHSLGRIPRVYLILDAYTTNAVASSYGIERTAWDSKTISLKSTKDYTIRIWIN